MSLREFVPGGFPLPQSPIYDGMGDFAPGGFPLPHNPVGFAGSLPKAPDMTFDDIAPLPASDSSCGMGCGCDLCAGMGALDLGSLENLIPGKTFNIPNTYLVAGALVAFLMFSASSKRGRR